jgi:hypothetical protein
MKTPEEKALEEIKFAVETGVTDRNFWHSRTPQERLWAMELMRQRVYGYDEHSSPKFQKVIEFSTLKLHGSPPEEAENQADLKNKQS